MTRLSIISCVLMPGLVASPALAAWIGDVADVAPASTVVNQRTSIQYASLYDAYWGSQNGDVLLAGPGEYQCWNGLPSNSVYPYLQMDDDPDDENQPYPGYVSVKGSGSDPANPAGNTIFNGMYDPNTDVGQRLFMTIFGSCGVKGSPMTFKDFAVTGYGEHAFSFGGTDPDLGAYKATDYDTSYVLFENLYVKCAMDRSPSEGPGSWTKIDGWGSAIDVRMGHLSNVVVQNCKFDGKNAVGIRFAQQLGSSYYWGFHWLIEGNTFTNMKNGVVINAGNVSTVQIRNNRFTNMTEYCSDDPWNTHGNAGVVIAPRGTAALPGGVGNILIEGNYFADCGYVPSDTNDPVTHPWAGQDLLGECGVQVQVHTYGKVTNMMIRDNTFAETASGGVMTSGIALKVTDYADRDIINSATTGTPGALDWISLANNTFLGMTEEDVEGTTKGSVGNPSPVIYPVKLVAGTTTPGITKSGDSDADDDIDVADIDVLPAGQARENFITKVLKTSISDTNLDYMVDIQDLGNLANKYRQAGSWSFADGDTDGDRDVDLCDLGNLACCYWRHFDREPGGSVYYGTYSPPIPEPTTLVLLALAGAVLARRRRR